MTLRQFLYMSAFVGLLIVLLAAGLLSTPVMASTCVLASHYGSESGSRTANGEPFTGKAMTAAHRSLPFNTRLRVTYQGRSVVVRINDRGPFIRGRSLDLSTGAARKLGMVRAGVARVCYERLS